MPTYGIPEGHFVYTVKQVASLTGLSEATLRAWERRYGVVEPVRSPAGYRLYDEGQLSVLREMASLVHDGVPASRAAEVMRESSRGRFPEEEPEGDLVAAAGELDPLRLRATIEQAFGSASFEQVAETWLPEQVQKIGDAWECGELSVAQEHFASAGLMRAIGNVYALADEPNPARPVLIGLPPGAHHHIMLFSFATCLRRLGSAVVYLGDDVPVDDWVRAATQARPRAAVLAVSASAEVPAAREIVDRLAWIVPPVTVWVGGRCREEVHGATALPNGVAQAAAILHRSLIAGGT